jgi:hypothetical protein
MFVSCSDFKEINTDPEVGTPQIDQILTYIEKELVTYKGGGEWYHENHQKMTWAQYLVQGEANADDVNTILSGCKYSTFYTTVLNHLIEIRRQVGLLTDEEQQVRQKLVAVTKIIQAFFALRITDQYGNIPYSEAGLGRDESILNPVYDDQEELLHTLVDELNNAIKLLSEDLTEEYNFSDADFIYSGDATKWIKFANAIKLRIATRFETQDLASTKEIISEVVSDGRLFESDDDQFTLNIGGDYRGSASADFEWKGLMWAARPMVEFMKKTVDPRIRVFYEMNGYTQASINAFAKSSDISPAVDIKNDTTVLFTNEDGEKIYGYRYIGAPTHRQDPYVGVTGYYMYIDDPVTIGANAVMISKWNRRIIQTCSYDYSGLPTATGNYVDVQLSYAEVCFMMAEFILKGYITGDAEEWYNKGIASSISTYDMIATTADVTIIVANKTYYYLPVSDAEIEKYKKAPEVKFDGINNLEKVYIQQFLNFYRLPDEGWIFSMRTGYPKYESSLLARTLTDDDELVFPRRIPTPEPGDLNLANWNAANTAQGFTNPLNETPEVLNSQRLWWDKNNPETGSGGN